MVKMQRIKKKKMLVRRRSISFVNRILKIIGENKAKAIRKEKLRGKETKFKVEVLELT